MKSVISIIARLAIGAGFLSAVADRFGFWGTPGEEGVAWGNWENFLNYTNVLTFGAKGLLLKILAVSATVLELILGIALIIGYKVKQSALLSGLLLLSFALAITINTRFKVAVDYSVFTAAACGLLLYLNPLSRWSVDYLLNRRQVSQ